MSETSMLLADMLRAKIVLITGAGAGAGTGIGKAVAVGFACAGARVVLDGRGSRWWRTWPRRSRPGMAPRLHCA
jgi:hypothetical protein